MWKEVTVVSQLGQRLEERQVGADSESRLDYPITKASRGGELAGAEPVGPEEGRVGLKLCTVALGILWLQALGLQQLPKEFTPATGQGGSLRTASPWLCFRL